MKVRCGSCRTEFEVPGAGRFACPVCGSVNVVRDAADAPPPSSVGGYPAAPGAAPAAPPPSPPPPPPDLPSTKIECPDCGFSFIIGDIAVAPCPMCGTDVETGKDEPEKADE